MTPERRHLYSLGTRLDLTRKEARKFWVDWASGQQDADLAAAIATVERALADALAIANRLLAAEESHE